MKKNKCERNWGERKNTTNKGNNKQEKGDPFYKVQLLIAVTGDNNKKKRRLISFTRYN